jgi:hypothetical protein
MGISTKAARFYADGDFGRLSSNAYYNYNPSVNSFSIAVWVKPSDDSGSIVNKQDGEVTQYELAVSGGEYKVYLNNTALSTTTVINDGSWHFLVLAVRAAAKWYKIYVDGVNIPVSVVLPNTGTVAQPVWIGMNHDWSGGEVQTIGNPFVGFMDELVFWGTYLDQDDVTQLYNNGGPISPLVNYGGYDKSASVAGWYRMGEAPNDTFTVLEDVVGTKDFTFYDGHYESEYPVEVLPEPPATPDAPVLSLDETILPFQTNQIKMFVMTDASDKYLLCGSFVSYESVSDQLVSLAPYMLSVYTDDNGHNALGTCLLSTVENSFSVHTFDTDDEIIFGSYKFAALSNSDENDVIQISFENATTETYDTFFYGANITLDSDRRLFCYKQTGEVDEIGYVFLGGKKVMVARIENKWHLVVEPY